MTGGHGAEARAPLSAAETEWLAAAVEYSGSGHPDLPGLPDMVTRMRNVLARVDCTPVKLAALVGSDAAIGARVVKVANSATARGAAPIHSVDRAVARLGFELVRSLVTGICVARLFSAPSGASASFLRRHYRGTRLVAAQAYALSRHTGVGDPDEALLAGLVHDIGMLPLLAFARQRPPPESGDGVMSRLLHQGHPRAGAALLRHWRFDERFVLATLEHEAIFAPVGGRHPLRDLLIVANVEAHAGPASWMGEVDRGQVPAYRRLGVDTVGAFRKTPDWAVHLEAAQLRMLGQ